MKKSKRKTLLISICSLAGFVLWTVAIRLIDVRAIGPRESAVGFATLNGFVHNLTGVNFALYTVTDWLGLVPIAVCAGFGLLGLIQWIKRKKLSRVDYSILVLGGFYAVVTAVYVLFEFVVIFTLMINTVFIFQVSHNTVQNVSTAVILSRLGSIFFFIF